MLSRRTKQSSVIEEPGVGKTAIAEGLAQQNRKIMKFLKRLRDNVLDTNMGQW